MRLAMLEYRRLHVNLLKVAATGHLEPDETGLLLSTEQNTVIAMRMLSWIASLQMNDSTLRSLSDRDAVRPIGSCLYLSGSLLY